MASGRQPRAGILSPRQLAAQYTEETGDPVSHAAIVNHFKKAGIDRDLAAKIRAKADAMVTQAMVTGKVTHWRCILCASGSIACSMRWARWKGL